MTNILRISEAASLALHTMYLLSINNEKLLSTKEIASTLSVSENHLAKVLQRLVKASLISSIRGPNGGFKLQKPGDKITLLDVYEIIDGPLSMNECLLDRPVCGGKNCILGDLIVDVNTQFKEYLSNKKISDLKKSVTH